jgi:serine phosphatase RsbU (regulator of sigma subunit)
VYLKEGLIIDRNSGYTYGEAVKLSNIASVYLDMGNMSESMKVLDELKPLALKMNYYELLIQTDITLGYIKLRTGDLSGAIQYFSNARNLSDQMEDLSMFSSALNGLYLASKQAGKFQDALTYYEKHQQLEDSLYTREQMKAAQENEIRYQYEKMAAIDSIENARQKSVSDAIIARKDAEANERESELHRKRSEQYALYGGLGLLLLFGGFMYNRFRVTQKQKATIEKQKGEVEKQKEVIEEAHKEITDSIQYAKRIQSAILPPQKLVKEYLPDSFILYKPKDVVAGDFYWMETVVKRSHSLSEGESVILFASADCTGHGVPGAMVSVVCNNGLNRSVREHGLTDPGKILDKTREIVISEFEKSEEDVKDGMDISLVALTHVGTDGHLSLQWAGANNPLWIIRNGEVLEAKPDKQPIGKYADPKPFTTHTIDLQKGDAIYIFTDGFQDQFGGEKGKKYKAANLKQLLLSIQHETMDRQRELLAEAFESWRGELEQVDDVCIIGVKV